MRTLYEVHVGNIGTVYSGKSNPVARQHYAEYVAQSKTGHGRAGGEDVVLTLNGEPMEEYSAD